MSKLAELCENCPLRRSPSTSGPLALVNLREKCAEIYYENIALEISDLDDILIEDHGADVFDAENAVECFNKIYRNNCPTSVIGHIGGNALGVVAR